MSAIRIVLTICSSPTIFDQNLNVNVMALAPIHCYTDVNDT